MYLCSSPEKALFWARNGFFGIIFIPIFSYHFVVAYLGNRRGVLLGVFYSSAIPSLFLFRTPHVYSAVASHVWGYYPVRGDLYSPFLVFFLFGFCGSLAELLIYQRRHSRSLSQMKNLQLRLMILAFAVGMTGAVDYVVKYPGINIYPWGYISAFLFATIIAFAILRTQLLEIQVIIKKTFIFAGLSAFILIVIAAISIGFQAVLEPASRISQMSSSLLAALIIILAYERVKRLLVKITDRFLYQTKYDYKHILNSYIEKVSVELNLEKIFEATSMLLQETMHPKIFTLYLFDRPLGEYVPYANADVKNVVLGSPIVKWLKDHRRPLLNDPSNTAAQKAIAELIPINAKLVVPLFLREELLGFMLLGEKMSDEDYSLEDILVLTDVAKTEAIAIKNARFIEELHAVNAELLRAQTMKQVADMADGMSHQFNNRFFSISSPLGLLRKKLEKLKGQVWEIEDTHKQVHVLKEFLEMAEGIWAKVESNAVRGGDLAKGLLRYSRPEKAGFQMHNISDIVTLSLEMLGYKHDDLPTIEIKHEFNSGVPKTWANASYLQDVFFILLDNSYDAIKQKEQLMGDFKGSISIHVNWDSLRDSIFVEIQDNGIGMKPEILEKVRAAIPYVTTKPSSSEKSGYGSGVQVLNRLVDLHGGRIQYDSVYMEGTQVVIKFPVRLPVVKP